MAERCARRIGPRLAMVADDNPYIANRYHHLGYPLNGGKPDVDEISSVEQRCVLKAALTTRVQKCLDILIVVVVIFIGGIHGNGARNDFSLLKRRAIVGCDNTDIVLTGRASNNDWVESTHFFQAKVILF